jgi:hypothetical protein
MNQTSCAVSQGLQEIETQYVKNNAAPTEMHGAISETGLRPKNIPDHNSEKSGKLSCTENKGNSDNIITDLDENAEVTGTFDEPDGSVQVVDVSGLQELDQEISRLQQESEMLREDLCKSSRVSSPIEKEQFASKGTETSNVADQAESDGMEKVNLAPGEQDVCHWEIKEIKKDQFESEVAMFQLGENNTDQFESGVSIPGLFNYDEMMKSMFETDKEGQDKGEIGNQQGDEKVQDHLSVRVTGASHDENDALDLKLIEVKAEDTIETIKDKVANEVDVEDNTEIREETETSEAFELDKIDENKVDPEASETSGTKRRENNEVVADDLIMKKGEVNALEVSQEPVSLPMEEVVNPVIHKEETELDREKKLMEQLRGSNVKNTLFKSKKDKQREEIRKIESSQESITSQLSPTGCPGEDDPQISDEELAADVKEMKRVKRFKMPYWLKKTKHGVLNSLSRKTELKEDQPDIGQDRRGVSSRVKQLLHAKKDSAVTKDLADLPAESHVRNVDDLDSRGERVKRSLSLSESCLRPHGGSLSSRNSLSAGLGRRVVTLGRVRGRQVVQSLRDWGSQLTPAGQDFENVRYKVGQSSFYLLSDGADPTVGYLYFNKPQPVR